MSSRLLSGVRGLRAVAIAIVAIVTMTSASHAGLIRSYGLNETSGTVAVDAASAENGVYQGSPTLGVASVDAAHGTAVSFNSSDDEVFLGSSLDSLTNNFTVGAWINPTDLTDTHRVISCPPGAGWGFGTNGGNLYFTLYGIGHLECAATLATNTWTHVAAVFDSSDDATFYVNGSSIGTVAGSSDASYTGGVRNFFIGGRGTGEEAFLGAIDTVKICNTALDQAGVRGLMAESVPEPGTLTLAVVGAFGLLCYAWRKRK